MRAKASLRWIAVTATLMLLLSGCNLQRRGTEPEEPGSSNVGSGVKLPPEIEDELADASDPTPVSPQSDEARRDAKATRAAPPPPPEAYMDSREAEGSPCSGRTGTALSRCLGMEYARRILSASTPRLVFEIHAVEGTNPNAQAISDFVGYIEDIVQKPGGIEVLPIKRLPRERTRYSFNHMMDLMKQHRTTNNNNAQVATVYILYVPEFEESAAGVAIWPFTLIGMNEASMSGAHVAALGGRARYERAVLTHELGHHMGLVEMEQSYKSPRPRTDPQDPNQPSSHNQNSDSVMYYAIDLFNPGLVIQGGVPIEFDSDDRADLVDIRDGKLG